MANDKNFIVKNDLDVRGGRITLSTTTSEAAFIEGNGGALHFESDHEVTFKESDNHAIKACFGLNNTLPAENDTTGQVTGPHFTFGNSTINRRARLYVDGNIITDSFIAIEGQGTGSDTYSTAELRIGKLNGPKIVATQENADPDRQGLAIFVKSSTTAATASAEGFRFTNDSKLGINKSDPNERLHVHNGSIEVTPVSYASNQDDYIIKTGAHNNAGWDGMGIKLKSDASGVPYISVCIATGTEILNVKGNNVGIGTEAPARRFEVRNGSAASEAVISGVGGADLYFRPENAYTNGGNFGIMVSGSGSSPYLSTMQFTGYNDGVNNIMVLKGDGKVGVGTTTPKEAFSVGNSINFHNGGHKLIAFGFNPSDSNNATATGYPADIRYDPSNGDVKIEIDGTQRTSGNASSPSPRLTIKKSGRIGIGTTDPDEMLHVEGSVLIDAYNQTGPAGIFFREGFSSGDTNPYNLSITCYDDGDSSPDALDISAYDGIYFHTQTGNARQVRGYVDGGGNWSFDGSLLYINAGSDKVAIGRNNPTNKFHVVGDARIEGSLMAGGASHTNVPARPIHVKSAGDSAAIRIEDTTNANQVFDIRSTQGTGLLFVDVTQSTTPMTIADDGDIVIGTATPEARLHVYSNTTTQPAMLIRNDNASAGGRGLLIQHDNGGAGTDRYALDVVTGYGSTNDHSLYVDGNGFVGVGTNSPDYKFESNSGTADWSALFKSTDNKSGIIIADNDTTSYIGSEDGLTFIGRKAGKDVDNINIESSGNVGLGVLDPAVRLDVRQTHDTVANVLANGSYAAQFTSKASGDTGRSQGILIGGTASNSRGAAIIGEAQATNNSHHMIFAVSSSASTPTERMRIDDSGSVRISNGGSTEYGSNAGADNLIVGNTTGSHGITIAAQNNSHSNIYFGDQDNNNAGWVQYRHDSNTLGIGTGTVERLKVAYDHFSAVPLTGSGNSSSRVIRGFIADPSAENSGEHFYIPGLMTNYFAGADKYLTVTGSRDIDDGNGFVSYTWNNNIFREGNSNASIGSIGTDHEYRIVISGFTKYHTQNIGVAFSNNGWRAKSIKIEVTSDEVDGNETWTTIADVTDYSQTVFEKHYNPGSTGYKGVRYTFTKFNSTIFRIASIFAYGFDSGETYFASKYNNNTLYGNQRLVDNVQAEFGTDNDLNMYHSGTHGFVTNTTGSLYLRTGSTIQLENQSGSEDLATFAVNGACTLYYDNAPKIATASGGVDITGNVVATGGNHTFYSAENDVDFSIGRDANQALHINVTDGDIKLTADQDSDDNGNHEFILDRTFEGSGNNNFIIRKAGGNQFLIDKNGNVGINDSTPDFKLAIRTPAIPSGSTYSWPLDLSRPNTDSRGLTFGVGSSGGPHAIAAHNGDIHIGQTHGTDSNSLPQFYGTLSVMHDGTASVGKVGILNTNPQASLEVNLTTATGSSSLMDADEVNDVQMIRAPYGTNAATTSNAGAKWGLRMVGRNDGSMDNQKSGAIYAVSEDSLGYNRRVGLALHTSSNDTSHAERVRITNTGNVGIGVTDPAARLEVKHDSNASNGVIVENTSTGTGARSMVRLLSDAAQLDIYATAAGYTGVSGWGDAGVISTASSSSTGLILNAQNGGIKFQYGTTTIGHVTSTSVNADLFKGLTYPNNSFLDFDDDSPSSGSAGSNGVTLASIAQMDFIIDTNNTGTSDAFTWLKDNASGASATQLARLNNDGDLTIIGALSANTKSFDIEHPTKDGMRLHHGVLEGPEHAVYVRGRSSNGIIELPEYWVGLVHEHTITVQLTPIGKSSELYVKDIVDNTIHVEADCEYFYFIQGERKDVERFEVEYYE